MLVIPAIADLPEQGVRSRIEQEVYHVYFGVDDIDARNHQQ